MGVPGELPCVKARDLPISILPVSRRLRNALESGGMHTLGQLLEVCAVGVDYFKGIGQTGREEIEEALATIPVLQDAAPTPLGDLPIAVLALDPKTQDALQASGVNAVGELLVARRGGLNDIRNLPENAERAIQEALEHLATVIRIADEDQRAELLDLRPLLVEAGNLDVRELVVPTVRALLRRDGKASHYEVIRARFGLEGSEKYTLEAIGKLLDRTRERVRQIEAESLRRVSDVVVGRKPLKHSRLSDSIQKEFLEVRDAVSELGNVVSEDAVSDLLQRRYGTNSHRFGGNELSFLLRVLGFRQVTVGTDKTAAKPLQAWTDDERIDSGLLQKAVSTVAKVLRDSVTPLPLLDICLRVGGTSHSPVPRKYILDAVRVSPGVEENEEGRFQIRFDLLRSVADKAYRILHESQDPMHYRAIWREMNHRLAIQGERVGQTIRSLTGQMASDDRFQAIGKSGQWCLSGRADLRHETILELMREYFHLSQQPATIDEVFDYVSSARPDASKHSVQMYLAGISNDFVQVSPHEYELTEWGGRQYTRAKSIRGYMDDEALYEAAEASVGQADDGMTLADLVREMEKRTGLSNGTLYRRLGNARWLRKHPRPKGRSPRITVKHKPHVPSHRSRETVRDRVQGAIEEHLEKQPSRSISVRELAVAVVAVAKCDRPSFYTYLSTMPGVEKYKVGSTLYCRLTKDVDTPIKLPSIAKIRVTETREEVERAVANLDVDNVDIGLLLLGRVFEEQLRAILEKMREVGILVFSDGELRGLASAIDIAVRAGLFKEKHHLTYLRHERNQRAHGKAPSEDERRDMMGHAPFLAGLYVEYIVYLEERIQQIE